VLRLGTWELIHHLEIPRAVIIDESVEIAKRYAGTESAGFVNGVLDRIADTCGRRDEPKGKGAVAINAEPWPEEDDEDDDIAPPEVAGLDEPRAAGDGNGTPPAGGDPH
jgi:hypothetical protein